MMLWYAGLQDPPGMVQNSSFVLNHKLYAALSGPNKQHRLVMRGSYEFLMWKLTAVKLHKKKVSYRSLKQRWRKHPDYFPVCRKCEDVLDLKCYF